MNIHPLLLKAQNLINQPLTIQTEANLKKQIGSFFPLQILYFFICTTEIRETRQTLHKGLFSLNVRIYLRSFKFRKKQPTTLHGKYNSKIQLNKLFDTWVTLPTLEDCRIYFEYNWTKKSHVKETNRQGNIIIFIFSANSNKNEPILKA